MCWKQSARRMRKTGRTSRNEKGGNVKARTIFATAAAAACGVWILFAQQRPAGPYTQAQAAAGRTIYQTSCASCHAADLSGREGPQLAGTSFMAQWGDRTAAELIR